MLLGGFWHLQFPAVATAERDRQWQRVKATAVELDRSQLAARDAHDDLVQIRRYHFRLDLDQCKLISRDRQVGEAAKPRGLGLRRYSRLLLPRFHRFCCANAGSDDASVHPGEIGPLALAKPPRIDLDAGELRRAEFLRSVKRHESPLDRQRIESACVLPS